MGSHPAISDTYPEPRSASGSNRTALPWRRLVSCSSSRRFDRHLAAPHWSVLLVCALAFLVACTDSDGVSTPEATPTRTEGGTTGSAVSSPAASPPAEATIARADDGATGSGSSSIKVGQGASGIAFGADAVWITNFADGTVSRVSVNTREVTATVPGVKFFAGNRNFGIVADDDAVWVAQNSEDVVSRIDPVTSRVVARVPVGNFPVAIAVGAESVWVANELSGTGQLRCLLLQS